MIKVNFADFFADLAAGLGLISVPRIAYIEADTTKALRLIERHGGPTPFICADSRGAFFQNGIGRQTNSWAGHAGIHVGEDFGNRMRKKHPELLKPRPAAGLFTDHDYTLPPVPAEAKSFEIIESQATVSLTSWPETIHDGIQAVAFLRDWTDSQIDRILYAAYRMYGAAYDVFEIARDCGFWMVPKLKLIHVCSSFTAVSLAQGNDEIEAWMKLHAAKKDVYEATPADLGRYLFSNKKYMPIFFRCDPMEARKKI